MFRSRPVIALLAAYALVFASFIGALGTARAAIPGGFHLCIAASTDGGPAPVQAEHELCCILACGAGGPPALAGSSIVPPADTLGGDVSVPVFTPVLRQFERLASAPPRGPPLLA